MTINKHLAVCMAVSACTNHFDESTKSHFIRLIKNVHSAIGLNQIHTLPLLKNDIYLLMLEFNKTFIDIKLSREEWMKIKHVVGYTNYAFAAAMETCCGKPNYTIIYNYIRSFYKNDFLSQWVTEAIANS